MGAGASSALPPCRRPRRFEASALLRSLWKSQRKKALMEVMPLAELCGLGKLPTFNDNVRENEATVRLVFEDELPVNAKIIFVSHRWLRQNGSVPVRTENRKGEPIVLWKGDPDPDDEDFTIFHTICAGAAGLAEKMEWDMSDVYVWIDYCCVRQEPSSACEARKESMAAYLAACDAFLVASSAVPSWPAHIMRNIPDGYNARAWTRVEALIFHYVSAMLTPVDGGRIFVAALHPTAAKAEQPEVEGEEQGVEGDHRQQQRHLHSTGRGQALYLEQYQYDMTERPRAGAMGQDSDQRIIKQLENLLFRAITASISEEEAGCQLLVKQHMLRNLGVLTGSGLSVDTVFDMVDPIIHANIEHLDLRGCKLSNGHAEAVSILLDCVDAPSCIKILDMSDNMLRDKGLSTLVEPLAESLVKCETTQSSGQSDAEDAESSSHNEQFSNLEVLYLGGNMIWEKGAVAFANVLAPKMIEGIWAFNTTLRQLYLDSNMLRDTGAAAIAHLIKPRKNLDGSWLCTSRLDTLSLEGNEVGDNGAASLANALVPHIDDQSGVVVVSSLRTLLLSNNKIGCQGLQELAEAIHPVLAKDGETVLFTGCLERISLSGNRIADFGAEALGDALKPQFIRKLGARKRFVINTELVSIDISDGREISEEVRKAVRAAAGTVNRERAEGMKKLNIVC